MGILGKSVDVTRCNVAVPAEGPDFEAVSFLAIEPGSEVRERMGVVPFELDSPYEVGAGRWAFRVRIDRRRPDPTAVRERLRELVKSEMEQTGAPFVGPKKRKELKALAEQELLVGQRPSTRLVECVIEHRPISELIREPEFNHALHHAALFLAASQGQLDPHSRA